MHLTQYLVEKQSRTPGNRNHIWIYDRSQSMYTTLAQLCEDMKSLARSLKEGDTLTLSWFSTEGMFRTILKGHVIGNDFSPRDSAINAHSRVVGLTCFSEVLNDSIASIEEVLLAFPDNTVSLAFFTAGYPVVSSYEREIIRIFSALDKLRDAVGNATLIGYGDYYNRPLLCQMTEEIGGVLVHADDLLTYNAAMTALLEAEGARRVGVPVGKAIITFGISTGEVNVYPIVSGVASVKDAEEYVYALEETEPPGDVEDVSLLYAGAYVQLSRGDVQSALEWLGATGDVCLIDKLANAFTTAEIGNVSEAIHAAVFNPLFRYVDGRDTGHLPKANAFCVLDAIDFIMLDGDTRVYPTHSDFRYKRIGRKATVEEGYPAFTPYGPEKNAASIDKLVWNKKRLNLSFLTRVAGHISLDESATGVCLPPGKFLTYQWRTYTIIQDGILNVRQIPLSVSHGTFTEMVAHGVIGLDVEWEEDGIFTLDLSTLPVMNRATASSYGSATELAKAVVVENHTVAWLKMLKYLFESKAPEHRATSFTADLTAEQLNYLAGLGIQDDGSYRPPTTKEDTVDYYVARTFELKLKGWSSLPPADTVIKMAEDGKDLPARHAVMFDAYSKHATASPDVIKLSIDIARLDLAFLRAKIQRAKFSVLLGNAWFDEFESRDGCHIELDDGNVVTFELGEAKVYF